MLHPNSLFYQYREKIRQLDRIEWEIIMQGEFMLHHTGGLQICYAPHNEYINEKAKILIVGITPGWSQTERAYLTAKEGIGQQLSDEEICFNCKMSSRFAGTMRKNLIAMLDELGLHEMLRLSSCADLFSPERDLLHTTSLVKYPCFRNGKNYSGHAPSIASSELLRRYVLTEFAQELRCLSDVRLIIPLGAAVEKVLRETDLPLPPGASVLWGFPHPSGLNGRRKEQFLTHREEMLDILQNCIFEASV